MSDWKGRRTGKDLGRVAFVRQFLTFSREARGPAVVGWWVGMRVSGRSGTRARRASRRPASSARREARSRARAPPLRSSRVGASRARDVVKTRKIRSRLANVRMKRRRTRASRGDAPSFTLKILSRRGALASFETSASSAPARAYVTTETRGRRAGLARPAPAGTRGPRRAPARDLFASPTRRPNAPARVVDELAVDAIAARVVAVDMALTFVAARTALTLATLRHPALFKPDIYMRRNSVQSTVCAGEYLLARVG